VLGVAGKYCAGKDALVGLLVQRGFLEIDLDRVGHQVLAGEEAKAEVLRSFGRGILDPQGIVDRRALGALVFGDSRKLRGLEGILHPRMVRRVEQILATENGAVVLNAAVLFRMGLDRLCDAVICVRASLIRRIRRARRRDGVRLGQALVRMRVQRGICPKSQAGGVDIYYVDNNRDLDRLRSRLAVILAELGVAEKKGIEDT
jgi:dephospho-CoA kinase